MDEEKANEATRRNTNNEISAGIVKVIDRVIFLLFSLETEGGRGGRGG